MRKVIGSFLILAAVLFNRPGLSATLTVTSTADSGPGSLRQALATAAAGDTIDFSVTGTITLISGELVIDKALTVTGPGAEMLSVERSSAAGTPAFRIFNIQSGSHVALSGLTIRQGLADFGGGIYNDSATVAIWDCAIVGNSASQRGGGIDNASSLTLSNCVITGNSVSSAGGSAAGGASGGGVYNADTLTAIRCVISTNTASVLVDSNSFGGGVFNNGTIYMTNSVVNANSAAGGTNGNASGGGIFNEGSLYVSQSTIAFNAAVGGNGLVGGVGQGGGIENLQTLTMDKCTLSGNVAAGGIGTSGAGGPGQGGGIVNTIDAYLANSTVSSNSAVSGSGPAGAGLAQGGGLFLSGASFAVLTNSTITANIAPGPLVGAVGVGSGLFNSAGVVIITNTILAGNSSTAVDFVSGPSGDIESGYNLIGSTNGPIIPGPGDQFNLAAAALRLGPLQDNGGPTFTHALLCGSPAINVGNNSEAPQTDQRGFPRIVDGVIDIGSYEYSNRPPTISNCPAAITVNCASPAGSVVTNSVNVADADGDPLIVVWTVDGTPYQTNLVAAGGPPTTATVQFTAVFAVGVHQLVVSVTDPGDCTATCSTTVTVSVDTTPPIITSTPPGGDLGCSPNPATLPTDDSVKAGTTATDNSGTPTIIVSHSDATAACITTRTFTITAVDACTNTSAPSTVVYHWKVDTTSPVLTGCPDLAASYQCLNQVPPAPTVTATDDCDGAVAVSFNETSSGTDCHKTISRIWTASDTCSNSVSCAQTITVSDTNAPVITQCPADVTVSCASQIPPPNDAGVVASDNCGGPVTVTHGLDTTTPGSCPGRFTVSRVYTASDLCSNSASCTQAITVNDTNAPVITQCPADVTVSCASQIPPPNDAGVLASDNCGGPVTVTHGPDTITPGSCPGRYTVSRVYTASDLCSNSASCTQTITVNDTNAPVITQCPADVTVSCASQLPPPNDAGVLASDNCGGPVTVTHGPDTTTPGSCPGRFTVSRVYTASDPCSNSVSCTQTITVNDTNAPVITQCPADVTVSCASQIPPPNDAGVAASDDCGGPVTVTHGPDTITPGSCPGRYTVSRVYTASDLCSNSASCTQTITVNDTNAPVITQCPADVTVSCASQLPPPNDAGVLASDNCGGPVTVTHGPDTTTPGSCPGRYTVSRVYTASDSCSNSASCTQVITVNDTNAPVITQCPANVTVSCASQIPPPDDAGVVASDNCGGPVTVTHGPDTITPGNCPGKYTVTRVYTASDSCSNSASCTQVITVNDTNAPVITQCPADITVSCASQIPPPDDAGVVASDDCGGPVTVTHGPDTITPGSCPGRYSVSRTYTASDACSNRASCTQTITVNDTNPPVITQCPADVTVSCASQIPPPNDAGVAASDDCGGPVTVTHGPDAITPGSCPGNYTVSRVYTASDSCSNNVSCTQIIAVNDTNPPVITQCPAGVTVSCASQIPPPNDAGVVASDDCGGAVTVTHGPDTITPGSCPGRYTVSRVYTASDSCGNSASCTQVIAVNDTNAPVITQCPANVTVSCASQIPPPDDAGVVASDDCGGPVTVTHGPDTITPGSCPGKYTVSRPYTASDACSNSASCTQIITVDDTNPPVITQCPADVTMSCASQIPPPDDAGVGASDNCGGAMSVTHSPDTITPGSCPGKYTVTRIYTASDSCSNSVSCTQTITVNDTNAPVITQCPADVTVSCASQIPPPNDAGVAASDNCGGPVTVTHGPDMITPGSCPGKYTVTRIYTASDSCSNSVSCTQTITVNDTNPPVITHCPADVTVSCTSQVPPADDSGVVASDDCGGPVTVTHSPDTITPGSCSGKFTVSRTYTAADPCGNSASCTQTITINDTNPPVIMQCPANVTVSCASQIPPPNDAGVVANDNCGGPVTVTHGLDTTTPGSCPGKFTVSRTYTASDACSNSASCTQTITVNDTNPPVITSCPADVTVSCASQVPPPDDSGVTAADDCGGPVTVSHGPDTITPGSCPGKYTVRRTYTVRDACSNSNSCTQTITVNDTTPPVITCVGNKTNQCGLGNLAFDTPTATDNCGTVTIAVLNTETNSVGGHKILVTRTWSATDPCGNTTTCSQTISTTDSTALTIACPSPLVLQCASPTGAAATVSVTVSDANGEALVVVWSVDGTAKQTNTVPAGKPTTTAIVTFTANFVVGSHQVATSVSNVSGCQTSCSTSVTVLGAGDLYPIAMSSRTIAGVPIGTVLKDIYNGAQPGNFGWLTWAGSPSEPTLVTSLTPPGNSRTYINPQNPNDHVVSIGDWVRGKPGLSNSDQVRKSLNVLETIDITVPVWDRAKGKGSGTQYHVVGFARVRLISYQLNKQNRITARFLGLVNCN